VCVGYIYIYIFFFTRLCGQTARSTYSIERTHRYMPMLTQICLYVHIDTYVYACNENYLLYILCVYIYSSFIYEYKYTFAATPHGNYDSQPAATPLNSHKASKHCSFFNLTKYSLAWDPYPQFGLNSLCLLPPLQRQTP